MKLDSLPKPCGQVVDEPGLAVGRQLPALGCRPTAGAPVAQECGLRLLQALRGRVDAVQLQLQLLPCRALLAADTLAG